jgi:hypothetical protein
MGYCRQQVNINFASDLGVFDRNAAYTLDSVEQTSGVQVQGVYMA